MNLKQILNNYTWFNVRQKLIELYPDVEPNLSAYEEVLEKLFFTSPVKFDIMLNNTYQQDEFDCMSDEEKKKKSDLRRGCSG